MVGISPSGPGTGLVRLTVAHWSEVEDETWVFVDVMVATAVLMVWLDSPRAS